MSMKKIYTCNICRDEVKDLNLLFGVHFSNNNYFTLDKYNSTDGVHICYNCAKQLRTHLNDIEITKEIDMHILNT